MRFLARLAFAWLVERACERINPTEPVVLYLPTELWARVVLMAARNEERPEDFIRRACREGIRAKWQAVSTRKDGEACR